MDAAAARARGQPGAARGRRAAADPRQRCGSRATTRPAWAASAIAARGLVADVALTRAPGREGLRRPLPPERPTGTCRSWSSRCSGRRCSYPFEGPGSEAGWSALETRAGTRLVRSYRARVGENWVLRWLGGHDEPRAQRVPRGRRARGRPLSRRVPDARCATISRSWCASRRRSRCRGRRGGRAPSPRPCGRGRCRGSPWRCGRPGG